MKAMEMDDAGEGEVRCLVDVAKQFKHWHQSCVRGDRIHAALWGEAVRLCQKHTPQRVACVLRIALAGVMQRLKRAGPDTEFVVENMSTPWLRHQPMLRQGLIRCPHKNHRAAQRHQRTSARSNSRTCAARRCECNSMAKVLPAWERC